MPVNTVTKVKVLVKIVNKTHSNPSHIFFSPIEIPELYNTCQSNALEHPNLFVVGIEAVKVQ